MIVGTIRDVTVLENEKKAFVAVYDAQSQSNFISTVPLTDAELADYRQFGDSYFGKEDHGSHVANDEFELFAWLMEVNATVPRERLLTWLGPTHEPYASSLSDEDLLTYYCEGIVATMAAHSASKGGTPRPRRSACVRL